MQKPKFTAHKTFPGLSLRLGASTLPNKINEYAGCRDTHVLTLALMPLVNVRECFIPNPAAKRSYTVGRVHFIPAHVPFRILTGGGKHRWLSLVMEPEFLTNIAGEEIHWDPKASCDIADDAISFGLTRIANELMSPGLASDGLLESLTKTVAIELARFGKRARTREKQKAGLSAFHLRRISDYIENAEGFCPTAQHIGDVLEMSSRHLARLFKAATGQTIHAYITAVRLRKAMTLLAETDVSAKELAHKVGFSTPAGFTAAFRGATGQTPKQFRTAHRLDNL
jgi:AraC family transcriptional regulator